MLSKISFVAGTSVLARIFCTAIQKSADVGSGSGVVCAIEGVAARKPLMATEIRLVLRVCRIVMVGLSPLVEVSQWLSGIGIKPNCGAHASYHE
jgi:hypothetical protein